jgi:hypothetical protein
MALFQENLNRLFVYKKKYIYLYQITLNVSYMISIKSIPIAKITDYFSLCLLLTNISRMFDKYLIHLQSDYNHVTQLKCNYLELVSKLSNLDYSLYVDVSVYAHPSGKENHTEYTRLFCILPSQRPSSSSQSLIIFTYF